MNKLIAGLITCGIILFASCKKETTQPETKPIDKIKLAEALTGKNEKIGLYADKELSTGFARLYVSLTSPDGKNIANANIQFMPEMDMGTMKHSSPLEQPVYNAADELYEGAVVFTMPSGSHHWTLQVTVNGEAKVFNVDIPDAKTKLTGTYQGTDGNSYVVSLIPPDKWEVGMNTLEILINRRENMMSFPPVDQLSVSFRPEMTSMGHGSPNNVDPVSSGAGRYKGKVNYTMTGDWKLHFKLTRNNVVIVEDATIDILF